MKSAACLLSMTSLAVACGGSLRTNTTGTGGQGTATASSGAGGAGGQGGAAGTSSTATSSTATSTSSSGGAGGSATACSPGCPGGYTCGTANGIPVCRAPSGIPLFSNVFVILMENTSLSTLQSAMAGGTAPNLKAMASAYATGSDYHGVAHPSLPNYIALTSGGTQDTVCDCDAAPGHRSCSTNALICAAESFVSRCSCPNDATNLADQLETAGKTWMAFGEDMGTPCNLTDSGNYAQRHVPFLYYDDIQTDASRCDAHVVDFGAFSPAGAAAFDFIAPNLVDDMHNPSPATSATTVNIPGGDAWIGPQVTAIVASPTYQKGGLLVVVWDEDDNSGGVLGDTDDPIGIYVISPFAKSGGYVSSVMANHYALLATIEDGLGLPRLGNAVGGATLADYFPAE